MATNFNTSNLTFRQLFGNGLTYTIPRFQRDYSWTNDQWDDLWQDILGTFDSDGETAHYMGYLVLQSGNQRNFEVIDGQQRLTTLSLMTLAILKLLDELAQNGVEPEANSRRSEQLRYTYIGYLDPVSLIANPKLKLNRNNDDFYRDRIVPLEQLPQRGLKASERLLRKAFEWFYRAARDLLWPQQDGAACARFLDDLSDRLFFTTITVTDELNAFKVFETLNSRGVRLSPTDLLKNHLFSVVFCEDSHPEGLDNLERRWNKMLEQLGAESFTEFLRAHWNSRNIFVREANLFKVIRNQVAGKQAVFDLLRDMEEDIDVYAAFASPEDATWSGESDIREHLRALNMFSARQQLPLLLAAYRAFALREFGGLLRACSIIAFRYNIIGGLVANEQERVYNATAQDIASGKISTVHSAIRALSDIYVADDPFRAAFEEKILNTSTGQNKSIARYILFQFESNLSHIVHDSNKASYSLEHVLPENPADNWPQFTDDQAEDMVYRLGNFALLEARPNRELGNASFEVKKLEYSRSQFETTRKIATENAEWNPERLAARQRAMVRQAGSIWRLAQFD